MLLSDCKYESWFDQTYNETYLTVKRAGRILLVHLCPALLNDLDELLSCTYRDMSKKEWQLRKHPNITGWLIVAFRYIVYHRIRAWYKEQRTLERLKNEKCDESVAAPFFDAIFLEETEEIMRAAIGERRYALLYAYKYEGVPVKELAAQMGKSVHAMEVALWRWQKICKKMLKNNGKFLLIILWIHVNFGMFLGV